jgi:hypothetical protein
MERQKKCRKPVAESILDEGSADIGQRSQSRQNLAHQHQRASLRCPLPNLHDRVRLIAGLQCIKHTLLSHQFLTLNTTFSQGLDSRGLGRSAPNRACVFPSGDPAAIGGPRKHRSLPEIDKILVEVWLIQHMVRSHMLSDALEVPAGIPFHRVEQVNGAAILRSVIAAKAPFVRVASNIFRMMAHVSVVHLSVHDFICSPCSTRNADAPRFALRASAFAPRGDEPR